MDVPVGYTGTESADEMISAKTPFDRLIMIIDQSERQVMLSDQKVVWRMCYSIKGTEKLCIPVLSHAPRPVHHTERRSIQLVMRW